MEGDLEPAVEGSGHAKQGVDLGWAGPGLQPCDRRLGRAAELGELALGQPPRDPVLGDLRGDPGVERGVLVVGAHEIDGIAVLLCASIAGLLSRR